MSTRIHLSNDQRKRLRSTRLHKAIRAYAEHLNDMLSGDLSGMSGTGIPLDEADRIPLQIQHCDLVKERERSWLGRGIREDDSERAGQIRTGPPMPDGSFLDQWLRGERKKLLILAPFGSGKSVLLASFACRLARELLSDNEYPLGATPKVVPWVVRLSSWLEEPDEDFAEFTFARSQNPLGLSSKSLKREDLQLLLDSGALLLMFDGFDELPGNPEPKKKDSRRAIARTRMKELGQHRYVLASRPFDGVERDFEPSEIHVLRELAGEEVQEFTRKAAARNQGIGKLDAQPLMVALENEQSHINALLYRPLFLAAWISSIRSTGVVPQTLSELMDAVLFEVFRRRRTTPSLTDEERQRLGALLLPLAGAGWGTPVLEKALTGEWKQIPILATCDITRICALAEKSGLMVRIKNSFYTIKVPVTEYLVGSYLAASCDGERASRSMHANQREFIQTFRRWFWRKDLDDVWLFAFNILLTGSNADRDITIAIVDWLLALTNKCLELARTQDLPKCVGGFADERSLFCGFQRLDCEPYQCADRILRSFLLPVHATSETEERAQTAIALLHDFLTYGQQYLFIDFAFRNLPELPSHRKRQLCAHMVKKLEIANNGDAIRLCWRVISAWLQVLDANEVVETLKALLNNHRAWRDFDYHFHAIIGYWPIGELVNMLTPAGAEVSFCHELDRLGKCEWQVTWPLSAFVISSIVEQGVAIEPAQSHLDDLLKYLSSESHREAWAWIGCALMNAGKNSPLDVQRANAEKILFCIQDAFWTLPGARHLENLLLALGLHSPKRDERPSTSDANTDAERITLPKGSRQEICPSSHEADRYIEIRMRQGPRGKWLQDLEDGFWHNLKVVGKYCAIKVIEAVDELWGVDFPNGLRFLLDGTAPTPLHYIQHCAIGRIDEKTAIRIADRWARSGRIEDAKAALKHHSGLVWFVRGFVKDGDKERVEYGVCRRNDPELLLDPKLQCAPHSIKKLLGADTLSEATIQPTLSPESIDLDEIWEEIGDWGMKVFGPAYYEGFFQWINRGAKSAKSKRLREDVIKDVLEELVPEIIDWEGMNVKAGGKTESKPRLRVFRDKFRQALSNPEAIILIRKLFQPDLGVLTEQQLRDRVFVCPLCDAVNERTPGIVGEKSRPKKCRACKNELHSAVEDEPRPRALFFCSHEDCEQWYKIGSTKSKLRQVGRCISGHELSWVTPKSPRRRPQRKS